MQHAVGVRVPAPPAVSFGRNQHVLAEGRQQMTAKWAAIGRRLTVGRGARRPPLSRGKPGHRSIVAPLMASVAASLAVGVGASMANKLARERRSKRDRRLGLLRGESLGGGLRRMALGQLDLALTTLGDGERIPDEKAVHETRKALKRLRALVRLLEPVLGEGAYERESAALRDAGRRLAGARDAEVMLATLEELIERHHRKLSGRGGVIRLHATLVTERDRARVETLGDPRARTQVVAELRACRVRVAAWRLPERDEGRLIEGALLRLYRQGAKRRRSAERGKRGDARAMHQWRKRVKDLRYVAEMLQPADRPRRSGTPKGKRARRRYERARLAAKRLHQLERRADKLGEVLGEDHDLAVLAQRIEVDGGHGRKRLLRLIAKRRGELRKQALREGERIYRRSPEKFMRNSRRPTELRRASL
jgi:CHAD domain-containing protein